MSDEPGLNPELEDEESLLPFDIDAKMPDEGPQSFPTPRPFRYIGKPLTAEEFTAYVQTYDFGSIPPDYVVLHHTAIPSTQHGRFPKGTVWDDDPAGASEEQIKQRRQQLLNNIKADYDSRPGWDSGPHLFIDDRWIWLFSPMNEMGIHAMWGNELTPGKDGKYHYSIGIEVIGYYQNVRWSDAVERLVGHAVAALKQRLQSFELQYMYPVNKPGRVQYAVDDKGRPLFKCAHPERLTWGGIASHRDYNKPECPGGAITEDYYMGVLREGWSRFVSGGAEVQPTRAVVQPLPGRYIVAVSSAKVRQGPSTSSAVALDGTARATRGHEVEFYEVVKGEAVDGNPWWGHLKGELGFISMTLVEPSGPTV